MKSLSWKIFIGFLLVIFLFTGLILYFSFGTVKEHYLKVTINNIKIQTRLVAENIERLLNTDDLDKIRSYVIETERNTGLRITVFDFNGKIMADSKINPELVENQLEKKDVKELLLNNNDNEEFYHYNDEDFLNISTSVTTLSNNRYIVRTSIYLSDINSITILLRQDILLITGFIILFSLIFVMFFSLKVIKPIRELSKASRKVALGDFDIKVFIPGFDELSNLARNFNQMTDKLKDYFVLAKSQQEQYLTLIASLQSGLIVLDKQDKILLHNKSFETICKTSLVRDRFFWELITPIEFGDLIKSVAKKKKHITKEIDFNNQSYLCSADYIESKNEIVVLFHNITEIKKLENVKRDFVVNVTHELRTPLTAIKGFIETIEDDMGVDSDITPYVEIIKRHTERLINIVQDLLTLSEVEQKSSHIEVAMSDIKLLFDNMLRIFEQKVSIKGINLISEIEPGLSIVELDPFRIEQVLINLIDNAIKYTDEGYVRMSASRKGHFVEIIIEDTGVGIPKEHHSRLFERFYTVDKSRSRKVGGTGLGLSIVKHIVQLHNGEIFVESGTGLGTKFVIKIPQKHFMDKEVI